MPIDPTGPLPMGDAPSRAQFEADTIRRLNELARRESGRATAIPWVETVPTSPWSNYGGAFATLAYCRDAAGVVHLRGLVKGGSAGQAVLTLPAGFRPTHQLVFAGMQASTAFGQSALRIDVFPSGSVTSVQASPGADGYLSLDGISFVVDGGPF